MVYILLVRDNYDDSEFMTLIYNNKEDFLKARELIDKLHTLWSNGEVDYSMNEYFYDNLEKENLLGLDFEKSAIWV
jgi:hypothetical protein